MPITVTDSRSNAADQIAHAVEVLGRATQRIAVFRAIYFGKKRVKSVNEIATATGLSRIRVLQEAKLLADNHIVNQIRAAGVTSYEKDPFYSTNKKRILRFVQDPVAFGRFPTRTRPRVSPSTPVAISIPGPRIKIRHITVDDIDSFARVRNTRIEPGAYARMPEARFKRGVARILRESGRFTDWGGERNDLYTSRIRISGRRLPAAFAFKGPGIRGVLTPRHMGKNADQIQRLFKTPAVVFIVQYWGQVSEAVIEQMEEFAKAKSAVEGSEVFYGIIDGDDSNRLLHAYPRAFQQHQRRV
jgi:hypothetical protein